MSSGPSCRAATISAKAMDYMLKRWPAFTRFLADGRICLSNNAAERVFRAHPPAACIFYDCSETVVNNALRRIHAPDHHQLSALLQLCNTRPHPLVQGPRQARTIYYRADSNWLSLPVEDRFIVGVQLKAMVVDADRMQSLVDYLAGRSAISNVGSRTESRSRDLSDDPIAGSSAPDYRR